MTEKCITCGKPVYKMDELRVDKYLFHKTGGCFKCLQCGCQLRSGSYAGLKGKFYCKVRTLLSGKVAIILSRTMSN